VTTSSGNGRGRRWRTGGLVFAPVRLALDTVVRPPGQPGTQWVPLVSGERVASGRGLSGWGPGGRRFKSCLPDPAKPCIRVLAADGLSNQEIGSRLFLSHRTIEWHLNKVFTKLDITSRRQLARALRDAELTVVQA
jgi:hypothetical protein